nr:hypothetical protein [Tanacetum cinerariifolium]
HAQPEDSNELFQKILEDLRIISKELAEYNNSISRDRHIFFNDDEDHSVQYKEYLENYSNEIAALNSNQEKEKLPQDSDIRQLIREECCIENFKVVHKKSSIFLNNTSQISPVHAIAPILPTEEPEYSFSMGYEHLSNTPKTKSDKVTESSAKNLVPIPSEYEVTSDDESKCDMPIKDDSSPVFTTFSNLLFDYNDDFTSSDDESLPYEDVPTEEFKVYSNPLFYDGEINSDEIDPHCFNVEYDLMESLLNRNTLIDSSTKFDFLLKEFSGELAHINPILPEVKEADFDLQEEIRFVENLLYDNSSPRRPKELNAKIADTIVESLSIYYPREIYVLEELLIDDSIPLPKNELSDFDQDNPLFPRPPPEPPDVEFDFERNSGEAISAVKNNINELNEDESFDPGGEIDVFPNVEDDDYFPFMFIIRIFLPYLIYPEVSPLLLFARSEDTIFDPGISV